MNEAGKIIDRVQERMDEINRKQVETINLIMSEFNAKMEKARQIERDAGIGQ